MRQAIRTIPIVVVTVLAVVTLLTTSTLTATVALAATTALIMGGSGLGNPVVTTDAGITIPIPNYVPNVAKYYIAPNSSCKPATCTLVPVTTPEGLLPPIIGTTTFDDSVRQGVSDIGIALSTQLRDHPGDDVVVFGYSQSGDIVTKLQRDFAADPANAPSPQQVSFVVIGNTNRPNGGILSRLPGLYIPGLNVTFDGAAPTNTGYHTTDISFEYDPVSDFPQYPVNLLADANAIAGILELHATYPNPYLPLPAGIPIFPTALPGGYTPDELQQAMKDPSNRQTYGDTTYVTIPAKNLPLLQPLLDVGTLTGTSFLVKPAVDLVQPALKVLVDLGYDRTIPYGQPTPIGLLPTVSGATVAKNLSAAVEQGVHQALVDFGVVRTVPPTPSVSPNVDTPALAKAEPRAAKAARAVAPGTFAATRRSTAPTAKEAHDTATSTTSAAKDADLTVKDPTTGPTTTGSTTHRRGKNPTPTADPDSQASSDRTGMASEGSDHRESTPGGGHPKDSKPRHERPTKHAARKND